MQESPVDQEKTERPMEAIRLDWLRYRWQHKDINPTSNTILWKGYAIWEFRLRNGLEELLADPKEEKIASLWRSIETDGLKNALIVKKCLVSGLYFVVVGNMRLTVLRGMASEDARTWNADPKNVQKRPTSGPGCDAWFRVPCIIAKETDSWNDWTEARIFSAPIGEDGKSSIEEQRHFEHLKYALLYEEYGYRMGLSRLAALRKWFLDQGGKSSLVHLHSGSYRLFIRTWLDVSCGLAETREIAREFGIGWRGAEVLEMLCNDTDIGLIAGLHDLDFEPSVEGSISTPLWKHDLVTCLDVLEHILPEDTDEAIRELWRVTDKVLLLTISWDEDDGGEQIGAKLHINIHPKDWWCDKIMWICGVIGIGTLGVPHARLRVFDEEPGGATFEVRR